MINIEKPKIDPPLIKLNFTEKSSTNFTGADKKSLYGKLMSETKELDSKLAMNMLISQQRRKKTFIYSNSVSQRSLKFTKFFISKTLIYYIIAILSSVVNISLDASGLIEEETQKTYDYLKISIYFCLMLINIIFHRYCFQKLQGLNKHRIKMNNFFIIAQQLTVNVVLFESLDVETISSQNSHALHLTKFFLAGSQLYVINRLFLDAVTEIRIKISVILLVFIYFFGRLPKTLGAITSFCEMTAALIVLILIYIYKNKQDNQLFNSLHLSQEKEKFYKYYLSILPEGIAIVNEFKEVTFINNGLKKILKTEDPKQIVSILFSLKNLNYQPKIRSARQSRTHNEQTLPKESSSPKAKNSIKEDLKHFHKMATRNNNNFSNSFKRANTKKMGQDVVEEKRNSLVDLLKEREMLQNDIGMLAENKIHISTEQCLEEAIENLARILRTDNEFLGMGSEAGTIYLNTSLLFYTSPNNVKSKSDGTPNKEIFEIKLTPALINNEDKYKTSLIAKVIHELRTPLNGILSMIQVAQETAPHELKDNYLRPALSNAKILLNLINDMLDVEQIRKGKLRMVYTKFKIQEVMEEALSLISIQAKKRGLDIRLEIEPSVAKNLISDPNRIRQIVVNLLGNALKFTFTGSITLKVQPLKSQPEKCIKIMVADTGIGISSENQKKLFKEFGKIDLGDKNVYNSQGVGLGLLISHTLALELAPKKIGGLKVVSEENKGSEFFFVVEDKKKSLAREENLDFSCSSSDEEGIIKTKITSMGYGNMKTFGELVRSSKDMKLDSKFEYEDYDVCNESLIQEDPFDIKRSTLEFRLFKLEENEADKNDKMWNRYLESLEKLSSIYKLKQCECPSYLLVDDNEFNLLALENYFQQLKIRVAIAKNGAQAVEMVITRKANKCCQNFEIIFMDCDMPVMNGFEASLRLQPLIKNENKRKTIIIACTAYMSEEEIQKCRVHGMDEYLKKPVEKKELYDMLLRILNI